MSWVVIIIGCHCFHCNGSLHCTNISNLSNDKTYYRGYRKASRSKNRKLLLKAANEGDKYAITAYEDAAKELFDIISGVKKKIFADTNCMVSYSGGIFNVGNLIKKPLIKLLRDNGMELTEGKAEPYVGATLLAKYYENS